MEDIVTCPVCGKDFHGWEGTCPYCEGQDLEEWREAAQAAENQLEALERRWNALKTWADSLETGPGADWIPPHQIQAKIEELEDLEFAGE